MNYKLKTFFTKRNTVGILVSGLAGFLALALLLPNLGNQVLGLVSSLTAKFKK